MTYSIAIADTQSELAFADRRFPAPFTSPHEGFAILKEEVDELWQAVKAAQKPRLFGTEREREEALLAIRHEAIQVAAMAIRIVGNLDEGFFGKDATR